MDGMTMLVLAVVLLLVLGAISSDGGRASSGQRDEQARARSQAAVAAARQAFVDDVARRWSAGELSSADRDALLATQFMPSARGGSGRPPR
jgi:hypothetical protein